MSRSLSLSFSCCLFSLRCSCSFLLSDLLCLLLLLLFLPLSSSSLVISLAFLSLREVDGAVFFCNKKRQLQIPTPLTLFLNTMHTLNDGSFGMVPLNPKPRLPPMPNAPPVDPLDVSKFSRLLSNRVDKSSAFDIRGSLAMSTDVSGVFEDVLGTGGSALEVEAIGVVASLAVGGLPLPEDAVDFAVVDLPVPDNFNCCNNEVKIIMIFPT